MTTLRVRMWGGAGGPREGAGGPGAYVTGLLPVTPGETLRVIAGLSPGALGLQSAATQNDADGCPGVVPGSGEGSGGGGRSAIQRGAGAGVWAEIVTAGGGGGSGGWCSAGAPASFSGTAYAYASASPSGCGENVAVVKTSASTVVCGGCAGPQCYNGGGGGGQAAGGQSADGTVAPQYCGHGVAGGSGSGGGGGWFGGGGGLRMPGGGGSSYTDSLVNASGGDGYFVWASSCQDFWHRPGYADVGAGLEDPFNSPSAPFGTRFVHGAVVLEALLGGADALALSSGSYLSIPGALAPAALPHGGSVVRTQRPGLDRNPRVLTPYPLFPRSPSAQARGSSARRRRRQGRACSSGVRPATPAASRRRAPPRSSSAP